MQINQSELAAKLGVSKAAVSQWFASKPPADRCPAIEKATNGQVTTEELRPDVVWQRVADPDWPHPAGRPCIDVAAPRVCGERSGDAAAGHGADNAPTQKTDISPGIGGVAGTALQASPQEMSHG